MKSKSQIKTFKRFIKEQKELYYTLDLYRDMTKEEVTFYMNQLLSLIFKMKKESDITVTVEPVLDSEEQ